MAARWLRDGSEMALLPLTVGATLRAAARARSATSSSNSAAASAPLGMARIDLVGGSGSWFEGE